MSTVQQAPGPLDLDATINGPIVELRYSSHGEAMQQLQILRDRLNARDELVGRECRGTPAAGEPLSEISEVLKSIRKTAYVQRRSVDGNRHFLTYTIPESTLEKLEALAASGHQASPSEPQAGQEADVSDTSAGGKAE